MQVRPAVADDAAAIAEIYGQGIAEREATFRTSPPGAAEMRELVEHGGRAVFLVAEREGHVDGWVRLVPYSPVAAYQGVGEYALYVRREARRQGVGRTLLLALGERARRDGYWKVVGRLFTRNAGSIALARECGFRDVGVHVRHGRLDGEWHDVLVNEWLLDEP